MSKTKAPTFTPTDRANMRWFWTQYLRAKTPWLVLVFALIVAQGFVYQQFLRLTESGLRVIFESGSLSDLIAVCLTVFGVFAFRGVMSFLIPRISAWVAGDAVRRMRDHMIAHLMRLDLAFFEASPPGEVILKLVGQAEALSVFVGQSLVKAARDAATVIILSGYLIYKQPILFLSAAAVLPLIFLAMQIISRRIKVIQAQSQTAMADFISSIEETVGGMRTIKIAGQEEVEEARLKQATGNIKRLTIRMQTANALIQPFIDFSAAFVYVLVIGGGGYMVLSPDFDIDGAGIIAFLLGLVLVFDPGRRLAQFMVTLQGGLVILDHIRSLYRETASIADAPDATGEFDRAGDLVLRDVTFGYDAEQPLFDGLNMTFAGGQTTAIVGPTGSGKTTILSLLGRLYDVTGGAVEVGGQDVRRLRVGDLRAAFSVVAQDIVIFNASIIDNIRYVRPEASDEQIAKAARDAELADLIEQRGGARVGPKGAQLSGGQKQRIAIARAFLREAPIVLLDEATSALDQRTEEKVKLALGRLSRDKTTIVVAHRLSSIRDADQIYVLDAGRLAEAGTHDALMAQGGLYSGLYRSQSEGYGAAPAGGQAGA